MALPASSVLLAATTPDSLNMNTPDFTLTPSTVTTTAIATPNSVHLPQSSAAKPAKKRKSWGQALPEPKTNLPPRKRAKTADEKEQRRIERIKRNRAAAHNSRERKRQEAERLEVENHALKIQLNALHYQIAQKDVTLDKCKDMIPGGLPQLTQEEMANIKVPEESLASSPCSYDTIDPRASLAPSSINEDFMTPSVKMEPMSPHMAPSSAAHRTSISLDQTRHSAAMLCDLQCRSSEMARLSKWSQTILYLMHLNIMTFYKSLMVALWTLWPTRMATMVTQISANLTASSTLMTSTTRPAPRRTRRRPTASTISSTRLPLASKTLSSLLNLLSHRLPALVTTAQPFATGPRFSGVSALQALPFSESESKQQGREVFERVMVEVLRLVAANGNQGSSGRSAASLGKSSSEERKDSGGIG